MTFQNYMKVHHGQCYHFQKREKFSYQDAANLWKAATGQATRIERERCVAECDALAQKWFAEERHSWGMAAGECAARLEADDAD